MKYRDHRGGLEESLKTTIEIESLEQLENHIKNTYKLNLEKLHFEYCGYDERIDWNTFYVIAKFKELNHDVVTGMSNNTFPTQEILTL